MYMMDYISLKKILFFELLNNVFQAFANCIGAVFTECKQLWP